MLLGCPWFKIAKFKQDWEKNEMVLKKGKRSKRILMATKEILSNAVKPMLAQNINLAEEIGDNEEDSFRAANPTVIPVFKVNVSKIVYKYVSKDKSKLLTDKGSKEDFKNQPAALVGEDKLKEFDEGNLEPKEAVARAESFYGKLMEKISRVQANDLQDLNLETVEVPKIVRVSIHLGEDFKVQLRHLLQQYMDVSA